MENNLDSISKEDLTDLYIRLNADFINYKRHASIERDNLNRAGESKAYASLLHFYDDICRYYPDYPQLVSYIISAFNVILREHNFIIMDKEYLLTLDKEVMLESVEVIQTLARESNDDTDLLKDVFSVGLFDYGNKKIVTYPKVVLYQN